MNPISENKSSRGQTKSVDVILFSYNHERFVEEALRSVFMQETSARVRIRIHDDASTDRTVEVIRETLLESPFRSSVEVSSVNRYQFGSSFKYEFAVNSDADFISFLDADDYWTDPLKIESQLKVMDENPSVSLCHTGFVGKRGDGEEESFRPAEKYCQLLVPGHFLSRTNFIGTLTVLIRKSAMPSRLPAGFDRLRGVDDYPIWAVVTSGKEIGYVDRVTGVYRLHSSNNFAGQLLAVKRQQVLDAMVWATNVVDASEVPMWLDGIEHFVLEGRRGQRFSWSAASTWLRRGLKRFM